MNFKPISTTIADCLRESGVRRFRQMGTATARRLVQKLEATLPLGGRSAALLPELATRGPFANARNMVVRPFAKPVPHRTIGSVWRKSSTRGTAIDSICEAIAGVLADRD